MFETCVTEAIYKSQIAEAVVEIQLNHKLLNDFRHWLKEDKDKRQRLEYEEWCKLVSFMKDYSDKCFIVRAFYRDELYIYGEHKTGDLYASLGPFATYDKSFGTFLWETYVSKQETMTKKESDAHAEGLYNGVYAGNISDITDSLKRFRITTDESTAVISNFNKTVIEGENKMETSKMFGKFDFGKVSGDKVRMSPYGLAVKNTDGIWVAYDAAAGAIMNVDVFNFDGSNFLYKVPAAINQVAIGDIVIHNRAPKFVKAINDDTLTVVDIVSGEITTILPTKSPFGFNFITKVMNLLGNITANADSPFGNMLPLMLMSDSNTNDMLPLVMMMNGGQFDMSNPLMLYALMGKGNNDMLPFLLMSSIGNISANGAKTNA